MSCKAAVIEQAKQYRRQKKRRLDGEDRVAEKMTPREDAPRGHKEGVTQSERPNREGQSMTPAKMQVEGKDDKDGADRDMP